MIKHVKIICKSFLDFFRDDCLMLAASMSFFSMMAIVPLCLLFVSIFGYFLGEDMQFYHFFLAKLTSLFPKITHEITGELSKIITYKEIGKLTLVFYGIISFQFFLSIDSALNKIFRIKAKRPFWVSLLLSLVTVTFIIAFLFLSFTATSIIPLFETLKDFLPGLKIGKITGFLIGFVVPLILIFLTATTLYILLPKRKTKVIHAISGGIFTAIVFEAAKHLFTLYVVKIAKLGAIYGPLSAFVIFLLWVYYSSCVFLIGAELVCNLGGKNNSRNL